MASVVPDAEPEPEQLATEFSLFLERNYNVKSQWAQMGTATEMPRGYVVLL
jgi:hypothetical protein